MKRSAMFACVAAGALAGVTASAPPTAASATPGTAGAGRAAAAGSSAGGYHEPLCERHLSLCADPYDSPGDEYVVHDEPSVLFKSGVRGSGNDITYTVTLPRNP